MKIWSTFRGRRAGLILRLSRTSARDIPSDPPASRRDEYASGTPPVMSMPPAYSLRGERGSKNNEFYIEILALCIPGGFCSFEILAPTKPHPAR